MFSNRFIYLSIGTFIKTTNQCFVQLLRELLWFLFLLYLFIQIQKMVHQVLPHVNAILILFQLIIEFSFWDTIVHHLLILLVKSHLQLYPCPLQINYLWNLGFLLEKNEDHRFYIIILYLLYLYILYIFVIVLFIRICHTIFKNPSDGFPRLSVNQ